MNPNGFVAAASMTSQTSRPIRSQSRASWLTRAMLTLRKTFSRSFASSAASGEDSSTTWSLMWRRSAAARARRRRASSRRRGAGRPCDGAGRIARVDPLRGEREVEVAAGDRARLARGPRGTGPVVVPGKVVDWRTTSWPARRCSRIELGGATGPARGPGPSVVVIGVGTQTKMTSAVGEAARPAARRRGGRRRGPPRGARPRRRRSASEPALSSATRAGVGVDRPRPRGRPRRTRSPAAGPT